MLEEYHDTSAAAAEWCSHLRHADWHIYMCIYYILPYIYGYIYIYNRTHRWILPDGAHFPGVQARNFRAATEA